MGESRQGKQGIAQNSSQNIGKMDDTGIKKQ